MSDTGSTVAIPQRVLEDLLTVELGITQKTTMQRHVALLVRLGYVKVSLRGLTKDQMQYDLVGKRLREIRKARRIEPTVSAPKGGKPRR